MKIGEKRYIGDGVYVAWDGDTLELTTENGDSVTNRIYIESEVLIGLEKFVADVKATVTSDRPRP